MNILTVVAHPDDEVLMCGGTLARYGYAGEHHVVHVCILAQGACRYPKECVADREASLQLAAREAARILCVHGVSFLKFPDQKLDTVPALDLARAIEAEIEQVQPELVITHGPADCNLDHNVTFRAVQAATRPRPGFCVRQVWVGECVSSTEWGFGNVPFQPNTFVDITAWLSVKLEAMREYGAELRSWPHPRSAKHVSRLAALRGATVGCAAAEAFQCLWRKA
jgi:LmbE family N-acetylglucosaminyl deacetylase